MITIRQYKAEDAKQALNIFRLSIRGIDESNYSSEQKQAWLGTRGSDVDKHIEKQKQKDFWQQRLDKTKPLIATDNNIVIGFLEFQIDLDQYNSFKPGVAYIDCLYVHPEYQRRGVAQKLYDKMWLSLLKNNIDNVWVHASKVAYPFFLKQGFDTGERQEVKRHNVILERYLMGKTI